MHDVEHVRLEALALAARAQELHVGKKLHLDGLAAFAAAGFAAPGAGVEGKVRGGEFPALGIGLGGEALADAIPGFRVGRGVAARGATERRLVDQNRGFEGIFEPAGCARSRPACHRFFRSRVGPHETESLRRASICPNHSGRKEQSARRAEWQCSRLSNCWRERRQMCKCPAGFRGVRRARVRLHARPVGKSARFANASGRPSKSKRPPASPAPGPSSTTRSQPRTRCARRARCT